MQIISIVNRRGGVGKTATAHALGAGLAHRGHRVLFVDLDSQSNLSFDLGVINAPAGSFEMMTGEKAPADLIRQAGDNMDIIPATPELSLADTKLTQTGREYKLRDALEPIRGNYDYVIIDTPPALGILTVNALTASDKCIIPAQAEIHSLQGIKLLQEAIEAVQRYTNPRLEIAGILLTRYNKRAIISKDMRANLEGIAGQIGTILFSTPIRECTAIKEAQAMQTDIFTYSPRSNAVLDYTPLIDAIERDSGQTEGPGQQAQALANQ